MIILTVVLIIIAIPFIMAIFSSRESSIITSITINRPRKEVFDYIKLLKNMDHYNKWVMADPDMKREFSGRDGTVGFIYAWDSQNKQAGKGEQEIIQLTEGERIAQEVRFERPFKGKATGFMTTTSVTDDQTEMTWGLSNSLTYMMRVMHIVLNLKKVLAKDMATSLSLLKKILEG